MKETSQLQINFKKHKPKLEVFPWLTVNCCGVASVKVVK